MHLQIQVRGLPQAARLRHYAALRLNEALARFRDLVEDARMSLSDINGPERDGVDKLCRIVLHLRGCSVLIIEELGADLAATIDRATERLRQGVSLQAAKRGQGLPRQAAAAAT